MKKITILMLASFSLLCFGCATKSPSISSNPKVDEHGLVEVSNGPYDEVFVKKDLDLSAFSTIIVNEIEFELVHSRNDFKLKPESQQEIADKFREILIKEIQSSTKLRVVEKASFDTLELSIAVTDLRISVPKDIESSIGTKVFSSDPVEISISGALFQAEPSLILASFTDYENADSFTFEEITKLSVSSDLKRIMRKWANTVSKGLNELQ